MQLEIKSSFHVVFEVRVLKMLTLGIPFSNHKCLNVTSHYNSESTVCFIGSGHSTVSKESNYSNNLTSCKKYSANVFARI